MILTDYITHDTSRLFVGLIPVVIELIHGEQHPTMHGFQSVPHVRQGPPYNHAHRVIHVGLFQLVFNVDREDFPGHFLRIFCH